MRQVSTERTHSLFSSGAALAGFLFLSGLSQCDNQTCFDFDDEGNRIEFPCTTCAERDNNSCTLDAWNIEPGLTCSLDQQPVLDDGTECEVEGSAGVCNAGVCEAVPVLAAGTHSTQWRANTMPLGSNGSATANGGGCEVATSALGVLIFLDVTVNLTATSDGNGTLKLEYEFIVNFVLLPSIADAEFADLTLVTELTNATPDRLVSTIDPAAVGNTIGSFLEPPDVGTSFVVSSPNEIVEVNARVTPLGLDPVRINWSEDLTLKWTLYGEELLTIALGDCEFDQQGPDIVFDVIEP